MWEAFPSPRTQPDQKPRGAARAPLTLNLQPPDQRRPAPTGPLIAGAEKTRKPKASGRRGQTTPGSLSVREPRASPVRGFWAVSRPYTNQRGTRARHELSIFTIGGMGAGQRGMPVWGELGYGGCLGTKTSLMLSCSLKRFFDPRHLMGC